MNSINACVIRLVNPDTAHDVTVPVDGSARICQVKNAYISGRAFDNNRAIASTVYIGYALNSILGCGTAGGKTSPSRGRRRLEFTNSLGQQDRIPSAQMITSLSIVTIIGFEW
jgi:hypothetical protein